MAAQIRANKNPERGSTTIESLGILFFVFISLSAFLFVAFVIFASAWVRYQSEQGLYCMAEGRMRFRCVHDVEKEIKKFLPPAWTEDLTVIFYESGDQKWRSKVIWISKVIKPFRSPFTLNIQRELSVESIRRDRKALRWSRGSW